MQKLMKTVRLRFTEEMCGDILRYMTLDDREKFEETVRHLVRVGLKTKMGEQRNSQGVESGAHGCQERSWNGQDRRRNTREGTK